MSVSSDDDTNSTEESDGKYDPELDCVVDMRMEDDAETPDRVDFDGDVDMERDGENDEEEDEQGEDEEEEDEDEEEDNGKEPWTIGLGEMVNTSAENEDAMVDDQQIVQSEQGQEMCENTPRPQPPAPAPRPQTPSLSYDHELSRLVGWSFCGLWRHKDFTQWCQLCVKLRQPETSQMRIWISICSENRQVVTVCPMSCSPTTTSPMAISLWRAWMAWYGSTEWVLTLQTRRWLLRLG